jgi:uncharacterized membrane protein YidH (DUF202 family)
MLVAHVVCGALATMCFLPIGVLVPRFARGLTTASWWFALHSVINGIIAFGLILAAFGIAVSSFDGGINSTHRVRFLFDSLGSSSMVLTWPQKCGLALFIFTLFQVALGIFTHWYKSTAYSLHMKSGRGPSNFLHMALGLVLVILGWTTAWEGEPLLDCHDSAGKARSRR